MGLINSGPNLHFFFVGGKGVLIVWLSGENVPLKGLCKYAPKNSQITCSSISLENKRVIHCSDPSTKHIMICKMNEYFLEHNSHSIHIKHETGIMNIIMRNKETNIITYDVLMDNPLNFCTDNEWKANAEHTVMLRVHGYRKVFLIWSELHLNGLKICDMNIFGLLVAGFVSVHNINYNLCY